MLSAGTGCKLFDFFFFFFFTFNGVLPGNETVNFLFLRFSVTFNVGFTKIIYISMPNRLNVCFSHFL